LLVVLLVLVAGLFWGPELARNVLLRNRSAGELATLHGRTHMWTYYWKASLERPLLGYGYALGARQLGPMYATQTHNALISVLLGCGWVGFAIVAGYALCYGFELRWGARQGIVGALGCAAVAAAALTNNMSLAFVGETWSPVTFVFIAFFALHVWHVAVKRPLRKTARRAVVTRDAPAKGEDVCTR